MKPATTDQSTIPSMSAIQAETPLEMVRIFFQAEAGIRDFASQREFGLTECMPHPSSVRREPLLLEQRVRQKKMYSPIGIYAAASGRTQNLRSARIDRCRAKATK